jgi:cobalt-zinc-cadmium resistance protein CzcA
VTYPIEQANSNIAGLKEIRSFSRFGLSIVTIVFSDETDIYWARQQVSERLQKVQTEIPKGIGTPELGPISTGLGEIYQYVVKPKIGFEKKYNQTELRTIQDWIVRRQLLGVKGVAEVSSFGGKLKQYEIAVNPNKLQSYSITIQDIFNAIEKNNQNTGGAYIEKGATVLFIRSEGLIGSIEDIENISISRKDNQTPLFVRDVAEVKIGYATRYGAMTYNDNGEVAGAVVMMLKGANSSDVIQNVKERIAKIQTTLPEGVMIEPFLDRSKMVNNAIGTVTKNLAEGALIVIFVLVLFLGNFRAGLLVASVIPLAMLFAVSMMNLFGVSGNLMSLGALDFGLIVDGAVIIVEAVMHNIANNKKLPLRNVLSASEMDKEVESSASKMMNSAAFGQVIILIVYLPILTLQGIEGKMFKPMAQTVAFALVGAFILSLTYIPMMSAFVLSKNTKHKPNLSDKIMERVIEGYEKSLAKILLFPKQIIGITLVLFAISIFALSRLGGEFIPALEEGDFAVETRVLTGSNLNTSVDACLKGAHILKTKFPEVEKVVGKIGSGEVPTDPMPMEAADLMVILKDKSEWTSASTFDELSEKMSAALADVPGVTFGFQYPVQMRFNELMTGAKQDVVCKIFGENLDTLVAYATKLGKITSSINGTKGTYVEPINGTPQIIIEYNRDAIAQYNLAIADVNSIVNTAFAGQNAGFIFEGEKRFNVVVRLKIDHRKNLQDVQNLLIPTPQGIQLPLNQLAKVSIQNSVNQVQREDAKRRIIVGFNVSGRDVQSIVTELQQKVNKEIKLPTGYFITYGGAFENLNRAKDRLMIAVPLSLLLIFVLLFFAFGSIKHALLIYTAIPLSAIGGILFLALRGMPFSISAGVGFIALFGVAVLNGIVLIAEFNRLKTSGMTDLKQIVLEGTRTRLRPVLMTAFVASLGFLPMAISHGAGAEVQRPLATVVIGGLLLATFLTLYVLPILYMIFESKIRKPNIGSSAVSLLLLLAFAPIQKSVAQTKIDLATALSLAEKNNGGFKNEKLKAEYSKQLIKSASQIPNTSIGVNLGQINSYFFDNQAYLGQTISLASLHKANKNILNEAYNISLQNITLKDAELKRIVTATYFQLVYLNEKMKLLTKTDNLYNEFLRKSSLRFQKGESNVLEKITADTKKMEAAIQLQYIEQEIYAYHLQFKYLLNSDTTFAVIDEKLALDGTALNKNTVITNHPLLMQYQKNISYSKALTKLEKVKLLPDLNLGFNSGSMEGTGANDIKYNALARFHSVQVGLSIPIFNAAQKAKIKASKLNETIVSNEYDIKQKEFTNELDALLQKYESNNLILLNYKKNALQNVAIIKETANKQFTSGAINFLDWTQLIQQAITIETNYLDIQKAQNEIIIAINYLMNK